MMLNVVYHCSDLFSPVLGTSLVSLFENNKSFDRINIYVIEKKISDENKQRLISVSEKYNGNIVFIPMQDINETENLGLVRVNKKWGYDGYNRLFLDDILPADVERVLYLDSDVLICSDLKELWETDLENCRAAACMDCLNDKYYDVLGFSKTSVYCNSGMILFDLKKWREDRFCDRIREYTHSNSGYVFFMEQSVFSYVVQDNVKILPAYYNVSTLMQSLNYKQIIKLRKPRIFYSEDEVKEAINSPRIIHLTRLFLVINRPWVKVNNHPLKDLFEKYKKMTPWADEEAFEDKRNAKQKMVDFAIAILPKGITINIASYLYNEVRIKKVKKQIKKLKSSGQ